MLIYSVSADGVSNPREELIRHHFLQASAAAFATHGFHGATMEMIARAAGYSPAALYRYFRSKDDLFQALINHIVGEIIATLEERPPRSIGFAERIRWTVTRVAGFAERNRALFTTITREGFGMQVKAPCDGERPGSRIQTRVIEASTRLMQEGIETGALRPGDPQSYAIAFHGLIHGFMEAWMLSDVSFSIHDKIDFITEMFMSGAEARPIIEESVRD
jgi:AcrR family transcriptional regulator